MFKKQNGELVVVADGCKRRRYDLNTHGVHVDDFGNAHISLRLGETLLGDTVAFFPAVNLQLIEIHPQIEGLTR